MAKESSVQKRARMLCQSAKRTLEHSVAPIAIIDYYLKHVNDAAQLELMERWLAEEVLSPTTLWFFPMSRSTDFGAYAHSWERISAVADNDINGRHHAGHAP